MTCTRCLGTWSSLGLIALRVARPREGRIVASILATAGVNDWLQAGFTLLCNRSNTEQRRSSGEADGRFSRASAG